MNHIYRLPFLPFDFAVIVVADTIEGFYAIGLTLPQLGFKL